MEVSVFNVNPFYILAQPEATQQSHQSYNKFDGKKVHLYSGRAQCSSDIRRISYILSGQSDTREGRVRWHLLGVQKQSKRSELIVQT